MDWDNEDTPPLPALTPKERALEEEIRACTECRELAVGGRLCGRHEAAMLGRRS